MNILNKKECKHLEASLTKQWGIFSFNSVVLEHKGRIFLAEKSIFDFEKLDSLRINSLGIYFGKRMDDGIRLSIEGAQLVGATATKNILEIDEYQVPEWLKGQPLRTDTVEGYYIITHKGDIVGSGKSTGGKLINYIPKERRIR